MSKCDVTGLMAHWEVTFADGRVMHFNGVRSMTSYLRQHEGCDITQSNFYDLERGPDPPSGRRAERFRRAGVSKIFKMRANKMIMNDA
jgi:hypothetical protein